VTSLESVSQMIIFIPSWKDISKRGLSTDDLVGQIRAVMDSDEAYKILMSDYIPNLRYFLHRYDLLEAQYENIFDHLQGFEGLEQDIVTLQDLQFPQESQFFYAPNGIYVYFEYQKIGEIYCGEGGHIQVVKHFKDSLLKQVDFYDDRGKISSRQIFGDESNESYHEYLDVNEKWIFREFKESGQCIVNAENNHTLNQKIYPNMEAIKFELLKKSLDKVNEDKKVIIAVTDKNFESIYNSDLLSHFTLSFFKQRYSFAIEEQSILPSLLGQVNSIIVESKVNLDYLRKYTHQKIHQLSPYDTRFNLSISQELKDEVIYFETRGLSAERLRYFFNPLFTYLYEAPDSEPMNRSFKLLLRVENEGKRELKSLLSNLIVQHFSKEQSEIELFETNQLMENEIRGEEMVLSHEAKRVKNICEGIQLLTINQEEELFEVLHDSRIIIDLSDEPDLFTQIAGISAGVPQINQKETEYIISEKNGLVVSDEASFFSALNYYLESLQNWQEARVQAVQQIRNYSGGKLFRKIKEILEED
jgi:accessory secretory protein Asp1